MPDLLLELFSEEIPARMQARAEADLARMMTDALSQGGLEAGATQSYSGPRRIVFIAKGVPAQSAGTVEETKGPRVGAPEKAVEGFLRGAGLKSLGECQVVKDPKGDYYLAKSEKPGRAAPAIIAEAVPEIVRKFPWPKSMRWGRSRIRWIRPLHSILCLFDSKPVAVRSRWRKKRRHHLWASLHEWPKGHAAQNIEDFAKLALFGGAFTR